MMISTVDTHTTLTATPTTVAAVAAATVVLPFHWVVNTIAVVVVLVDWVVAMTAVVVQFPMPMY